MLQYLIVIYIKYLDWYLKDVGINSASETMKKARKFILDHGGI